MSQKKLRQHIASEAARLMCGPGQPGYDQAKREALQQLKTDRLRPHDYPTNLEIREEIVALAKSRQAEHLQAMWRESLRLMHALDRFHPQLIGSVLTGPISASSTIDMEVFADDVALVIAAIDGYGEIHPLGSRQIRKDNKLHKADYIHLQSSYPFRLMVFPHELFESFSVDLQCSGVHDHANTEQLAEMLAATEGDCLRVPEPLLENKADRFEIYATLLWPLEEVMQNSQSHPEGDALYHSLQVYEQARNQFPYDEEFLLAALLHDVGKAIDANDPVTATLVALEGWITERTAWFIEHQLQAHAYLDHELGTRARKRLEAADDFEQLLFLVQCDRAGREQGVAVPEVDEVIVQIRGLAVSFDGEAAGEGEQNE